MCDCMCFGQACTPCTMQHVPTGVFELFGSPLMAGVGPAFLRDLVGTSSIKDASDESLYDFISRRFSSAVADNLVDPMVSGIFAGDPRDLSVLAFLPVLKQWEASHGSVIRGAMAEAFARGKSRPEASPASPFVARASKAASVSFRGGMSTFINALHAAIDV